jgi:hypothetical protein
VEWRSIRWTRVARLAGIAVGGVAALALASAVVGAPEAPQLDHDIGLRVATPAPATTATTPLADPRPIARELSRTVHDRHSNRRHEPSAERGAEPSLPAKPKPAAHTAKPASPPAAPAPAPPPSAPLAAPAPAPAPPPVASFGAPAAPPAPAPPSPAGTAAQQEFGFEN